MRRKNTPPDTKRVKSRGKVYLYFVTGRRNARGHPILVRLPDPSLPGFGEAYGALCAAKRRREREYITTTDLAKRYMESPTFRELKDKTQYIYSLGLRKFTDNLPTAPAKEVTGSDMVNLMDVFADTPGAANSMLSAVQACYKWGRSRGFVDNDPTKDVKRLKTGEHQPWADEILKAALASNDNLVRLTVHLLYYTAQRHEDIVSLTWDQIKPDGRIWLTQEKTDKPLKLPIHKKLAAELARHERKAETIIAQPNGKRYAQVTVRRHIQEWVQERFGVHVVPHGLRKNAVNTLLELGVSTARTASISGQSLKVVEHYAKARNQHKLSGDAMRAWEADEG